MFGRSAQAAGDHQLDAFIVQVSSSRYDAADNLLVELHQAEQLNDEEVARCHDLLHQARRLALDQERLAEVGAGLAFDEERTCAELRAIASSALGIRPADEPSATTTAGNDRLEIWLLGSCRLSRNDRVLDGDNCDQVAGVLRYLAAQPVCGVHKDQLAAVFWPDSDERSARRSLHQVVYNIRRRLQAIGADHELEFVNDRYRLGADNRWRDVDELEQAIAVARMARDEIESEGLVAACERVDELYTGDFLSDHLYDEWAEGPRRHYRMLFREAAGFLLNQWWEDGRLCHVVELAERVLGFDPADEEAARRLMSAHHRLGHPQLAAATFAALAESLAELGLAPSAETTALVGRMIPQLLR